MDKRGIPRKTDPRRSRSILVVVRERCSACRTRRLSWHDTGDRKVSGFQGYPVLLELVCKDL